MKVELVKFYVKDDRLQFYTIGTLGGEHFVRDFAKSDERIAIYLGEDEEHVWLLPLFYGHLLDDFNIPKSKDRIIISSVQRFVKDDVVLSEPGDYVTEPFSDMIYEGRSLLE